MYDLTDTVITSDLYEIVARFWDELSARPAGPLGFRFIIQPVMGSLLAIRDGYRDAIDRRTPYFWAVLTRAKRRERLAEGIRNVTRVLIFACVGDAVYQLIELKSFRPLQMLVIAFVLAFVPYLLVRGPANRAVCWFRSHYIQGNRDQPLTKAE